MPGRARRWSSGSRDEAFAARDALRNATVAVPSGKTARAHLTPADVPAAPFFGARVVEDVDVRELWPCFDLRSLYRLSWGGANVKGEAWEGLVRDEFEPRLAEYQRLAERERLLEPRFVYGYFPAAGSGDDVIVYDPQDPRREIARFPFTRQIGGEHLCLADYLREPVDGGAADVVALQVVTVGRAVSHRIDALQAAADYSASYFLHGFSVQSAEALAEYAHRRVAARARTARCARQTLLVGLRRLPRHRAARDRVEFARRERAIGTTLTEAFQIVPEQSTAAIVMHHPQAAYFNAAAVREMAPA